MPISQPSGYGSPVNVTGSRAIATTYTAKRNTLAMVTVTGASGSGGCYAYVNGVQVTSAVYASATTGYACTVTFAIKTGDTYSVSGSALSLWFESYA